MTVFDTRCDRCGRFLTGPGEDSPSPGAGGPSPGHGAGGPLAIRFLYHPGNFFLKDDSGLLCLSCWDAARAWLGEERPENRCARCGAAVEHSRSLHLHRAGDPIAWQLCRVHAVEFLNRLRTVEPKLDVDGFSLSGDWRGARPGS